MKCLVLGGGGFIGSSVSEQLLKDGHSVRIFEHPRVSPYRPFRPDENAEWFAGDFLDISDVERALEGIDVVIHLISTTLPKNSNENPIYDVETNVIQLLKILDVMLAKKISRIIFTSSGGTIYGIPQFVPITEDHPTNPIVSYGITKLTIEKFLLMYKKLHGLKPTILRVANPYGERQSAKHMQGAVGVFLEKALADQAIEIWCDGSITREYIYVGYVAKAFSKAITYNGTKSIFNIGSGRGIFLNELIDNLESALEKPIIRVHLPSRDFDAPINTLDISLAKRELDWEPEISLHDGLKRTLLQLKRNLKKDH